MFVGANALSGTLGLEAAALIVGALPTVVGQPDDTAARATMSYASLLAGLAFGSAGTHLAHAIQYPIGALTHTAHGLGVGLLLPYVLEACLPHAVAPLSQLGRAMGAADGDDEAAAVDAIRRIVRVRRAIGVPDTLAEIGVAERDLPRVVELAVTVQRLVNNAPGPDPASLVEPIVRRAWRGTSALAPLIPTHGGT